MNIRKWFSLGRKAEKEKTREELAELKRLFAARYNHFKLLLKANTRTHELIAELEEALRGIRPYGMHYVRALCTRISTAVFQMIRNLDQLAPGKYENLYPRFKDIQQQINPHIQPKQYSGQGALVLRIRDLSRDQADMAGSKMAMLGEAKNKLGLKVPTGFVITAAAYRRFISHGDLKEEVNRLLQATDPDDRAAVFSTSSRVMQLIMSTPMPPELEEAILAAHDILREIEGDDVRVAVRSSALGEDLEGSTFAGQYRSILNVEREALLSAYKEVVASKYSVQATAYRISRGIKDEDVAMCVGCLAMVPAESSGVAYSSSPVHSHDTRVSIHSVWGLPKPVVDGSAETDMFIVSRSPFSLEEQHIADKAEKFVCDQEKGTCRIEVQNGRRDKPSLTPEQTIEVARNAVAIEEYFGTPQDVEWAITSDNTFTLLQCRPLLLMEEHEGQLPHPTDLPEPLFRGGSTASPGVGVGPVHVIRKDADAITFPDGGIMVLRQSLPSRAALLSRCSAVVAEQGGIAGHLANVAREFGVPALFGVKGALDGLQNRSIVTVDADSHAVYAGAVEPLLQEKPVKKLMRGSPVQAALRGAARHIVRLNLLDPDSPDFRPRNCRTFHDIMRFCHEMAVREMFEFGTETDFLQTASRQLICNVPKQFWVLNLDDGISDEGRQRPDRCVLIEHVESIPMRALWAGMQAVPWEGPPPIHGRGLMSVMFEATMNPNLEPTQSSQFAQKNYFLISRNYCSLQSRFGFHFCGAEALVDERDSENYASFQFKGGAANQERRILRARFVADLLEEFDFRTRVRGDNLAARIEGFEQPIMEHRLKVLGYLITHTRQLDMIMTDTAAVARRRKKFLKDIAAFDTPDLPDARG
ncbi:PEP/pyruvate-binding domain-containing protein [Pseudodesulfovibrio tunisiensis]|uniref:PEP/pyruvate-binding domain-containing protein n=1 Tax=Pseudodesulfovibrio tunisiensis TaxID=463192 RepID=UPI001FB473CA|nr:PEP/pyruvate-binding domain-containing protein [Pseudodesulfovibrio tunisiensis]